ncbi:hypothetical protein GQ53DRAFT_54239 [Thozetella sp. PMI_491]|nr:hypothetical protein GQ53DRAFT_54239 [Thozetella sp. PMI_491]
MIFSNQYPHSQQLDLDFRLEEALDQDAGTVENPLVLSALSDCHTSSGPSSQLSTGNDQTSIMDASTGREIPPVQFTEVNSERNEKEVLENPPDDSSLESTAGSWPCDFPSCSRVCFSQKLLIQHKRCHKKAHLCSQPACVEKDVRFSTKRDLQRHNELVHEGKRLTCQYCSKQVKRKDNLRRHIMTVHRC